MCACIYIYNYRYTYVKWFCLGRRLQNRSELGKKRELFGPSSFAYTATIKTQNMSLRSVFHGHPRHVHNVLGALFGNKLDTWQNGDYPQDITMPSINGHFRNLNWRYLPYVRPM